MINKNILLQHHRNEHIDDAELYAAYKIFFGTLVSASRLQIINLLHKGKKNVSEIMAALETDQTAVSHDLARLKRCGFVLSEVDGKYRYYRLNDVTIRPLIRLIDTHMKKYCIHILRGDKHE